MFIRFFSYFIILLVCGCVDPYTPPTSDIQRNFLVVDGFVNTGNQSAEVKLSLAVALSAAETFNPLSKAIVQLEEAGGKIIPLTETSRGSYTGAPIDVNNGETYQLRVKVSGKEYISDKVEMKRSPVLDSVNWRAGPTGITIDVDSHDVNGSTKYYLWTYTETWEYNSELFSQWIWNKGNMIQRRAGQYVYVCYKDFSSTKVLTSSTTSNSLDVVNNFVLTFIPKGSKKVSRLYSILVQQRALDAQAFKFWQNIQKSTESLGGLFDPLPSEVTGNMHNANDASENVLGYFSGGEVQEKRIYINWDDIPLDLHIVDKLQCDVDSIRLNDLFNYTASDLYIAYGYGSPATIGYVTAAGPCLDCRLQGGVLERPSFWPR